MSVSDEQLLFILKHMLSELEQLRGVCDKLLANGTLTPEDMHEVTLAYHEKVKRRRAHQQHPEPKNVSEFVAAFDPSVFSRS
jgi:chromosomal replication initiation ATPase DnaA